MRTSLVPVVVAAAVLLAACGGSDDAPSAISASDALSMEATALKEAVGYPKGAADDRSSAVATERWYVNELDTADFDRFAAVATAYRTSATCEPEDLEGLRLAYEQLVADRPLEMPTFGGFEDGQARFDFGDGGHDDLAYESGYWLRSCF